MSSCCPSKAKNLPWWRRVDYILWVSLTILLLPIALQLTPFGDHFSSLSMNTSMLLGQIWWGMLIALIAVGFMGLIPQQLILRLLGNQRGIGGLWRAVIAGLLFDVCSHGIAVIGVQLYRQGARLSQVFAFLIASPWNSLSSSLILLGLVGWGWTLVFIALSLVVALSTGLAVDALERRGMVPDNPNREMDNITESSWHSFFGSLRWHPQHLPSFVRRSWQACQPLLRWLLLGLALTVLVKSYVPQEALLTWFGPTLFGLLATLGLATLLEVCSEGSIPLGAELVTTAQAPGNGFTFLMAGIATDLTEFLLLRGATGSWRLPLLLPLFTVPQVLVLGYLLNIFG